MSRPTRFTVRPGLALSMAARGLLRDPAPSLLAVTILALGLALPATFFSFLVGGIRPLPVPEGERVVRVDVVQPERDGRPLEVAGVDLQALQGSAALEALGGFQTFDGTLVDRDRAAARVSGAALTPEVLPLLRIAPDLGRLPVAAEAESTVLLGYDIWQEMYGGDAAALGRTVELEGVLRTVVGVLPRGFGFPFKQNVWVLRDPATAPQAPFELVARLAPGATLDAATAELAPRWQRGDALRDAERSGGRLTVKSYTGGRGEAGELVAFGGLVLVALCLLLIACANVANLLLVRATERVRALGIQSALGASRGQIAAQLFLESLLLAVVGGGIGLLVADTVVAAIQRTLAAEHFGYFWMRMAVDGTVLTFTAALVVGTALVAGVLPVVRVVRTDVQRVLKEEGGGAAVGGGGTWSNAFVTAQLALSCGALVAAGLTGRSLAGSRDFGAMLPSEEILLASVDPHGGGRGGEPSLLPALESALSQVPGARSAALALGAPGYLEPFSPMEVQGSEVAGPEARASTGWNAVTPGYFAMLDLQLRAGRGLAPTDDDAGERVAVVNESFARRFSPDEAPLGRQVRIVAADSSAWFTVVGVVADADMGAGERMRNDRVYVPLAQIEAREVLALVRGGGGGAVPATEVRRAVAGVDVAIPLWGMRTLADGHAYMMRIPRALAGMAVAGGSAGLLVAMVGLYGLLAFRVRQRRRELGVRLALGADGATLVRSVLLLAARQLVPAVVVGLLLAWLASPVLAAFLLGLDPRSADTYAGVALIFVGMGMLAALVPALRAGAVDPARVLRGE